MSPFCWLTRKHVFSVDHSVDFIGQLVSFKIGWRESFVPAANSVLRITEWFQTARARPFMGIQHSNRYTFSRNAYGFRQIGVVSQNESCIDCVLVHVAQQS